MAQDIVILINGVRHACTPVQLAAVMAVLDQVQHFAQESGQLILHHGPGRVVAEEVELHKKAYEVKLK